jgi:23S rRNA A2030 N6-methylase RlmJ
MGSMEKISEVLNTTFEQDMEIAEKQRKIIDAKKQIVAKKEETGLIVLDDQEEIKNGLRAVIANLEEVMQKLQDDIKIGSKVFSHQVYSQCAKELRECYKEMAEIDRSIFDCRLKLQQELSKNNKGSSKKSDDSQSISMTAGQLADMLENARKNSSMNSIDATFKVVE